MSKVHEQFATTLFYPDLPTLTYNRHRQAYTVSYRTILIGIANENVNNYRNKNLTNS